MSITRDKFRILTLSFSLIFLIMIAAIPLSAEDATEAEVFVDLDGDGFNDSAEDANNDGIPDPVEAKAEEDAGVSGMQVQTINPFASFHEMPLEPSRSSWKANFGLRRLAVLGMGASRCDFNAGSGDNDNLGNGGMGGGGACAGGVCIPH